MLRAVIFDFNGIIVDDEPVHFRLFQKVLGEEGIALSEETYYARYLGFDDRGAFQAGFADQNRPLSEAKLGELVSRKAAYYQDAIRDQFVLFPGAKALVASLSKSLPLAVACRIPGCQSQVPSTRCWSTIACPSPRVTS